jgi:hypothetical protein
MSQQYRVVAEYLIRNRRSNFVVPAERLDEVHRRAVAFVRSTGHPGIVEVQRLTPDGWELADKIEVRPAAGP